jgi:RNase P subunit RPR2
MTKSTGLMSTACLASPSSCATAINQTNKQTINQSINQAINQASRQASKQTNNQTDDHTIKQTINQSINQTIKQSIGKKCRQIMTPVVASTKVLHISHVSALSKMWMLLCCVLGRL